MQVVIHDDRARLPTRGQVGYDLVCIEKVDVSGFTYDTGISVKAPEGYYAEIVAKSSVVKHNTMLAGGIIDPNDRETLKIRLTSHVECPFSLCQIILRPMPPDIQVNKINL